MIRRVEENMWDNIMMVWHNTLTNMENVIKNISGVLISIGFFLGATFAPIKTLFCLTFVFVMADMILGISVAIKDKGKGVIESSKARNSLIKLFFYWLFLALTFLVESGLSLSDGFCFGPKVIFGILSAVELWSVATNAMILQPNLVIFKLFKRLFTSEIAKKLGVSEDIVKDILEEDLKHKKDKEK